MEEKKVVEQILRMSCSGCNKKISTLQQAKNIAIGVINLISNNPAIEEIAKPRLLICSSCPFIVELIKVAGREVYKCSKCSCLVEAKTRVMVETCPIGKW